MQADKFVGFCLYDGTHGTWPDQPRADELVASFFLNVSASLLVQGEEAEDHRQQEEFVKHDRVDLVER